MSHTRKLATVLFVPALLLAACGGDEAGSSTLEAAWTFESGDCTSNGIEEVHVSWTLQGGTPEVVEFACDAGQGALGEIAENGGSYSITAEGFDSAGVARAESLGQTVTFSQGRTGGPIDITLRPKPANVVVNWAGCPAGVILPYFISLYRPPAEAGGEFTDKVTEVQESCSSSTVTLMRVAPGDYIVELDSRAVTPAVRGTAPVTVVAGEDAEVTIE